jgi:hypothetical protein
VNLPTLRGIPVVEQSRDNFPPRGRALDGAPRQIHRPDKTNEAASPIRIKEPMSRACQRGAPSKVAALRRNQPIGLQPALQLPVSARFSSTARPLFVQWHFGNSANFFPLWLIQGAQSP